ncbi:substrate-binding domain-containing protein [Comamonadaceae bacterium OTU4NAUVB1]|nr:substrate-binding domain-containing protein [Comamonadaceae bacterium OTU4NAUVB1]
MNRAPARATIADVAATAGVSKATVSRFFNHRERLLSPAIAARVAQAIAALGYSPHPMAQALSRGHTRLIGLVVADIANPYSVAVLRGAERACQAAGYLVVLFNLGHAATAAADGERAAIAALAGYRVDGFILNTLGGGPGTDGAPDRDDDGHDASVVAAMALHGRPAVLVDRRHDGLAADLVALDNAGAMRSACEHLREQGYRHLLYASEPLLGISTRHERAAAFRAFLATHAGDMTGRVIEGGDADADAARLDAALRELRRSAGESDGGAPGPRRAGAGPAAGRRAGAAAPTTAAVIAGNALVTLRVAAAVARLGWRWGSGLGFVGFDDAEWAPLVGPGLSAISQPTDAIGHAAATRLVERLRGLDVPTRELRLSATLVPRASSRRR